METCRADGVALACSRAPTDAGSVESEADLLPEHPHCSPRVKRRDKAARKTRVGPIFTFPGRRPSVIVKDVSRTPKWHEPVVPHSCGYLRRSIDFMVQSSGKQNLFNR